MTIFDRLKPLIITISIFVAIGMAGNFIVDFPVVHKTIKILTNKKLAKSTDFQIDYKAMQLNFLTTEVDLFGLRVTKKDQEVLRASHIKTQVSLLSIFLGSPKLSFIDINELNTAIPIVVPQIDSDSIVFWPPDFEVPVNRIKLSNSSIALKIRKEEEKDNIVDIALKDSNAEFRFNHIDDWSIDAGVSRLNLYVRGRHVLRDVNVKTKLNGNAFKAESVYTYIKSKEVDATGQLTLLLSEIEKKKKSRFSFKQRKKPQLKSFILKAELDIIKLDTDVLGRLLEVDGNANYFDGKATLNLDVPFSAAKSRLSVDVKAHSNNATLADFRLLDSDAQLYITREKILFSDVFLKTKKTIHAKGAGELFLNDQTNYNFDLESKKVSLKKLSEVLNFNLDILQTELNTNFLTIKGTASPLDMTIAGRVTAKNVDFIKINEFSDKKNLPVCKSDLKIKITENKVSFPQDILSCSNKSSKEISEITLNGDIYTDKSDKIDLTISSSSLKFGLLEHISHSENSGELIFSTNIGGTSEDTKIDVKLKSDQFELGQLDILSSNLDMKYHVNNELLKIRELDLFEDQRSYLKLRDSTLIVDENLSFNANINSNTMSNLFVKNIVAMIDPQLELDFSIRKLNGNIKGNLLYPLNYETQLYYEFGNFNYKGEEIFSILSGKLDANENIWSTNNGYLRIGLWENKFNFERSNIMKADPKAKTTLARIGYNKDEDYEFSLETIKDDRTNNSIREFSIDQTQNHLAGLPFIGKSFEKAHIGSELEAEVFLKGKLSSLQGKLDVKLKDPFILKQPIPSVNLSAFIDKGKINIHTIKQLGNNLLGSLEFDLNKPGIPYNWYFRMKQYDMRYLLPNVIANDPRNYIYIDGNWTMRGKLDDWWHSKGSINLSAIHINLLQDNGYSTNNISINETQPFEFLIDEKGWRFKNTEQFALTSELLSLVVKAQNNIPPEKLDLELSGEVDLSLIEKLFSKVSGSSGFLKYLIKIKGSVENPEVYLSIKNISDDNIVARWRPISLSIQELPPTFSNILVDIELKDKILHINKLYAEKGSQGNLNITGTLTPFDESLNPVLYVKASKMNFNSIKSEILEEISTEVSTDLIITGENFPLNITGAIKIDSLSSRSDFDIRKQILKAINTQKLNSVSPKKEVPALKFDVNIKADQSIKIKNKTLDLVLSSNLQLTGTDIAPIILGKVSADKGSFNYKRTFNITRSVLIFDEPTYPSIPSLDVLGETSIPPYTVEFMLTGKVNDPKVSLSVNPSTRDDGTPITKVDTVLLLATGELPEDNPENSTLAASNEIFSFIVGMGEEPLEKIFDMTGQNVIRQVYIDSYLSEQTNRPVMRLTLPVNFFNIVDLLLQVDQDQNMKAIFAYNIVKHVSLNGYVENLNDENTDSVATTSTNLGFDLRFKFSFE